MDASFRPRLANLGRLGLVRALRRAADERGQAALLMGASFFVMALLSILVLDVGVMYGVRRHSQTAADLAALAAAADLPSAPSDPQFASKIAAAKNTARLYLATNGFDQCGDGIHDAIGGCDVAVTATARTGNEITGVAADASWIEVTTTSQQSWLVGKLINLPDVDVGARAVAELTRTPSAYSVITLDSTGCQSLKLGGNGNFTSGPVHVNSSCAGSALFKNGNGNVEAPITVVGGAQFGGSGNVTPAVVTGATPVADPFAEIPPPSGLPVVSGSWMHITGAGDRTVNPGVYVGGLKLSNNGNVTFNPGIYVMQGGGLEISSAGNVLGAGVMIYNTCSTGDCSLGGTDGPVTHTGGGNLELTPLTYGPYQGLLIFQDRASTETVKFAGGGNVGSGTVYAAGGVIEAAGDGNVAMQFIAGQFAKTGNGNVEIDYDDDSIAGAETIALRE